jgi:hypothetical protein
MKQSRFVIRALAAVRVATSLSTLTVAINTVSFLVGTSAAASSQTIAAPKKTEAKVETDTKALDDGAEEGDLPVDLDGVAIPTRRWYFGAGVFYSSANQLVFSKVNSNGTGYSYTYSMQAVPSLALEAKYEGPHAWGLQVGFEVDRARAITDFAVTGNGSTQTGSYSGANQPMLTIFNLYLNAFYRWKRFYLPFGLNVAGLASTDPPVPLKDMFGSEGLQAGMGFELNPHCSFEALGRALVVQGKKQTDPTSGTTEVGVGYLLGAHAGVKFYF